jgi:flagellar protein FlaD
MSILDKVKKASRIAATRSKKGSRSNEGSKKVERKVIRKSKQDGNLDDLMDFSDIEGVIQDDTDMSSIMGHGVGSNSAPSDTGLDKRVVGIEEKIVQMDGTTKSTRSRISIMDDRLANMEQNILKLLSVYEVVKRDINPFIDDKHRASEDDKIDPALLGIEGAELIKTPDLTDDLEGMDFSTDMFLSKDTENEIGSKPGEGISGLDLSDIDIGEEPDGDPSLEELQEVEEPPEPEVTPFLTNLAKTPESGFRGGADIREHLKKPPISPPLVKDEPFTTQRAGPILEEITYDYRTVIIVMRWVEFMFERVTRDRISALLDYYKDVGWISETVKSQIMAYARGEIQNILRFEPDDVDEETLIDSPLKQPSDYKKVSDWRLSADDHLKSLLFVTKIAGLKVNKDTFNSLEEEIKIFTRNLSGYHGV